MSKTKSGELRIVPYPDSNHRRIYANYVQILKTPLEVSFKFCDYMPSVDEEEIKEQNNSGKVEIPISAEVVLPNEIAKNFLQILKVHFPEEKK